MELVPWSNSIARRGTRFFRERNYMKVLLTGHKGYIGAVAGPILRSAGHEVSGLDTDLFAGREFARISAISRGQIWKASKRSCISLRCQMIHWGISTPSSHSTLTISHP